MRNTNENIEISYDVETWVWPQESVATQVVWILWSEHAELGKLFWNNGYNALNDSGKNTILGLIKLDSTNTEYLKKIIISQNKIGIHNSLEYIVSIILTSNFRYSLQDLFYLTTSSWVSRLDRKDITSIQMLAEEHIFELGYFDPQKWHGKYYKPHFFQTLLECKEIIGKQNIDLSWFIIWYESHVEKDARNIMMLRKKPKQTSFFESITYLFSLWEPWYVWQSIHRLLRQKSIDFSKEIFSSLEEMQVHIWSHLFTQEKKYRQVWEGLSIRQKNALQSSVEGYDKDQLRRDLKVFQKQTEMTFKELAEFLLVTGYSFYDLYIFQQSKIYVANIDDSIEEMGAFLERYGLSKKGFLLKLQQHNIHVSLISLDGISTILSYGWINEILILINAFDKIPSDYYTIQSKIQGVFLWRVPEEILYNTSHFLQLLSYIKVIIDLDPSFRVEYIDWNKPEELEQKYHTLLEKRNAKRKKILWMEEFDGEIDVHYFEQWMEWGSYESDMNKLEAEWYSKEEIVHFCNHTGYSMKGIMDIIFFEELYGFTLQHVPEVKLHRERMQLSEIINAWLNARNMRADSIAYYRLLWYPFQFIRRLPFNYGMSNESMSYTRRPTHEDFIFQIQEIRPDFDFAIFQHIFPEYFNFSSGTISCNEASPMILRNILRILTLNPNFDFSKISPYLLFKEGSLLYEMWWVLTALLCQDWSWNLDYAKLNISLLETIVSEENLSEYFMEDAEFDAAENITKGNSLSSSDIRKQAMTQTLSIAKLPQIIEESLNWEEDITFRELLDRLLKGRQNQFTYEQRYEIIVRAKRYFDSFANVISYREKYKNAKDLLSHVNPYKVNYFDVSDEIECQQEGINLTFYFAREEDYYKCLRMENTKKESGGMKLNASKIPGMQGTICFVNGPVWVVNDFTQIVKIHENRHISNGFLFDRGVPEDYAKDEIIAYMSDGTSQEELIATLTNPNGLYNYYESLMLFDFKAFQKSWQLYTQRITRHISEAFEIADLYPDEYLDLLAITPVKKWNSILKSK